MNEALKIIPHCFLLEVYFSLVSHRRAFCGSGALGALLSVTPTLSKHRLNLVFSAEEYSTLQFQITFHKAAGSKSRSPKKHIKQSTLHRGTMRSWGPTAILIIIVESTVEWSPLSISCVPKASDYRSPAALKHSPTARGEGRTVNSSWSACFIGDLH